MSGLESIEFIIKEEQQFSKFINLLKIIFCISNIGTILFEHTTKSL